MQDKAAATPADIPPPPHRLASARRTLRRCAGPLLVAAISAALAGLGHLEAMGDLGISPVWPAAGFSLAITIVYGHRMLPALALGLTLAELLYGNPLPLALWRGCTGIVGAGIGAELVRRFVPRLGHPEADAVEMIRFLVVAAGIASGASALLGTWGITLLGDLPPEAFATTALTWWLGDATGVITVAPFVLAWLTPVRRQEGFARPVELALMVVFSAVVVAIMFVAPGLAPAFPAQFHTEIALLPLLVWAPLRFGVIGAATIGFVIAAVTTSATAAGLGPYGDGTLAEAQGLQFMLALGLVSSLLLGITRSRKDHLYQQAEADAAFVRSIAENLPGAVYRRHLSADGRIRYPYMGGRFAREFGLVEDTTQQSIEEAAGGGLRHVNAQDLERMHERLHVSAANLEPLDMELRFVRDDGSICWARSISRPYRSGHGGVTWDGILLDITEEKAQRDRIEYLARHDPLTGLLNRTGLSELLEAALSRARRQGSYVALCLFDLDDFKEINDHYGHFAGDAVLQTLAERIRATMRLEDIKARFGGDEFVVVQTDVQDRDSVTRACQRLTERMGQSLDLIDHRLRTSVSVGIAVFPADADSADDLLIAADHAMYRAKQGETGPVFYSREMGTTARVRTELVQELTEAIERRELSVHYQPQIHVPTGEVSGIEALVRWHHPKHDWISPGQFIPLAEERGLVSAIDLLVLERVLADIGDWPATPDFDFTVAINLSGASVRDSDHRERLARTIHDAGVPAERLELELTETTLVHATDERVSDGLRALAALGIRFSADDFGTGYGSLTYLRSLPITRIKIDRSFVQGAPTRAEDAEIVRALIALARNLGLHVIAEGIETQAELDKLTELGCSYVQGFYFARPMPRNALEEFVATRGRTAADDGLAASYVV